MIVGSTTETLLEVLSDASVGDNIRVLDTLVPVLKEQEKDPSQRQKIARKHVLAKGFHFGSKNYVGEDILRNAIMTRLADYTIKASIVETMPVAEGWFVANEVFKRLRKKDVQIKTGGLVMVRSEDLYRIYYGAYYVDLPYQERVKMYEAIDRRIYYKNDEYGVLVTTGGNVFLFTNLNNDRVRVKEPHRLLIFLRIGLDV